MFTFGVSYFLCLIFFVFVGVFVGAGVFMRARRVLVCIHCICYSLYIYLGEWGNGKWVIKWINWGNGKLGELEYKCECKRLLKWPLHFLMGY